MIKKILLGSLLLCLSNMALAGPVTFNFYGLPYQEGDPLNYSQAGIDLSIIGLPDRIGAIAVNETEGLGVLSNGDETSELDGDRNAPNEKLKMTFSEDVELLSVVFGSLQRNDDFKINLRNGEGWFRYDIDHQAISGEGTYTFDADSSSMPTTLVDRALIFGASNNDDYYIREITVRTVPEPVSLALIGSGLAGFGFSRRNKA